jgi:hypothetical protein
MFPRANQCALSVNYRFVLHQLTPERCDYRFLVRTNTPIPISLNRERQWQRAVCNAAIESVLGQVVLQWMFSFADCHHFYACQAQPPFDWPTATGPGFELLLIAQVKAEDVNEIAAGPIIHSTGHRLPGLTFVDPTTEANR